MSEEPAKVGSFGLGTEYLIFERQLQFDAANDFCNALGATPAKVASRNEFEFVDKELVQEFDIRNDFWICNQIRVNTIVVEVVNIMGVKGEAEADEQIQICGLQY